MHPSMVHGTTTPPRSPSLSPASDPRLNIHNLVNHAGQSNIKDPILYQNSAVSPMHQQPLFGEDEPQQKSEEIFKFERAIDMHMALRNPRGKVALPIKEEYFKILQFQSCMMRIQQKDPRGFLRRVKAQNEMDRKSRAAYNGRSGPARHILPASQPIHKHTTKITKPTKVAQKAAKQGQFGARPIRINGHITSPVRQTPAAPRRRPSSTPDPGRRNPAPHREDKDFNALPDFCPPISDLDGQPGRLKADWKGNPMKIGEDDPNRHLLHPDEIKMAEGLRLDCATYLTSKRRIFKRRVYCAQIQKEFRKTDAQQACKIDVNKASRLHAAYEKIGWLEKRWLPNPLPGAHVDSP